MASVFAELPEPAIYRGQRHFARARLNLPARAVTFNGIISCSLLDASQTGAKVGAAECPRVGAMVVLEGLPLELFGTVRWSLSGLFGFEFESVVDSEQIIALRHYADGEKERQKQAQLTYARKWVEGVY